MDTPWTFASALNPPSSLSLPVRFGRPPPSAGQSLLAFGESPCLSDAGRDPSRKEVEQQKVSVLVALDGTPSLNGVEDSNCLSELTLFGRSISSCLQDLNTCLGALSGLTWSARLRLYVVDRFLFPPSRSSRGGLRCSW